MMMEASAGLIKICLRLSTHWCRSGHLNSENNSDMDIPNTIRVRLMKRKSGGLGFLIKQRSQCPAVVISELVKGGEAEDTGLIQTGDIIVSVNGIDIFDMAYSHAVEILKNIPAESPVILLLRGPQGYTTRLETTFQENGIPRTIRVSEPFDHETLRSKNFGSPSPTPKRLTTISKVSDQEIENYTGSMEYYPSINNHFLENCQPKWSFNGNENLGRSLNFETSFLDSNFPVPKHSKTLPPSDVAVQVNEGDFSPKNTKEDRKERKKSREEKNVERKKSREENDSPKIIVTSDSQSKLQGISTKQEEAKEHKECEVVYKGRPTRRSIEIRQNSEEITVIVDEIKVSTVKRINSPDTDSISRSIDRDHQGGDNGTSDKKNRKVSTESSGSKDGDNGKHRKVSKEEVKTLARPERRPSHTMSPHMLDNKPSMERRSSSVSPQKKVIKLRNLLDEKLNLTDTLHMKAMQPTHCTPERCMGSIMAVGAKTPAGTARPREVVLLHAKDFFDQYFQSIKRFSTPAHQKRWLEVTTQIEQNGIYELKETELVYGAKTAWRNASRCIGRIQWSKLQVFDARYVTTARSMFECICNHIKYATNKGNLRSAITIFPPRTDGKHDFRVWNGQLIKYAGYMQPDGTVMGDASGLEFTEICQKLGWKGPGGRFDVLPLLLSANGQDPEMFEIPKELILEVIMKHPKYPWMEEMDLKWYCLPAVSNMLFDVGGLEFPAAPFNGWYMCTEIGGRDFGDPHRYNLLEPVATKMGLDTSKLSSLWKDLAMIELNIAVLYSFQTEGVTITDHHSASESFMKHLENEQRLRGGCPADWVWIVPPISGNSMPVYHQEMLNYLLKPSYEYQDDAWKTHVYKKDRDKGGKSEARPKRKFGFREIAKAVKFSAKLMGKALAKRVKATILYATETGKSERYSKTLCEIFKRTFDAKVMCMEEYDLIDLEHEALVLIVTSTFGNGDPPENGEAFSKQLMEMKADFSQTGDEDEDQRYLNTNSNYRMQQTSIDKLSEELSGPLSNVRFSVFGLGSTAYPNFCAFAHHIDRLLGELGGERIVKTGEGNELCGQENTFKKWGQEVFKVACETFCVGEDIINMDDVGMEFAQTDRSWSLAKFKLLEAKDVQEDLCKGLAKTHNKKIFPCKLICRKNLQAPESSRKTNIICLDTQGASELEYQPGDHVGVVAANREELVDAILQRLSNSPPEDQVLKMECLIEKQTPLGVMNNWVLDERLPECSIRTALSRYLDIISTPTPMFLELLATQATDKKEQATLEELSKDPQKYEDWKHLKSPGLFEVLEEFKSLGVPPTLLLKELPLLQSRFYSISSSLKAHPGEIHLTVAVVTYRTQGGTGPLRYGVCSTYLDRIEEGDIVPCFVRGAPSFHLPEDRTSPVIMVGPGTGIAPFRSFWQHREIEVANMPPPSRTPQDGKPCSGWGDMTLIFGCRNSSQDDIYRHETSKLKQTGVLKNVHTALSREKNQPKVYVQDVIREFESYIYQKILEENGHFYVCGDVSMASDVQRTLEKVIAKVGKLSPEQAKRYLQKMRETYHYHEDIFGVTLRTAEVTDRMRDKARQSWTSESIKK